MRHGCHHNALTLQIFAGGCAEINLNVRVGMCGIRAVLTFSLNYNVKRLAKQYNVTQKRITYLVFRANQPLASLVLDILGYLIGIGCRRRAGARRICENVRIEKPYTADEIHRQKKVLLTLTGEADHQVGGEIRTGKGGAKTLDILYRALGGVSALHCAKHLIRSRLHENAEISFAIPVETNRLIELVKRIEKWTVSFMILYGRKKAGVVVSTVA